MIRRAIPLNHGGLTGHLALGVVFLVMFLLLPARASTPVVRVSVATNGTQANSPSFAQAISADGRYVAFTSTATNLVAGDTNGQSDIFVHDTVLHTTSRALLAGGAVRNVEDVFVGDVSADGRLVCFLSAAAGLVAGDTNGVFDVFVYDFSTQESTRISVASDGTQGNATSAGTPRMSADGRFIVFQSEATNFAPLSNGNFNDIFVHDRVTHHTTQISTGVNGTAPNGFSVFAQISATGRFVTFSSIATNLTAQPDTNGSIRDIYVHDRQTGVTERASVGPGGAQGNGDSITGAISADGRFLAYESSASNLVANDTNALDDIFLLDRQSGQTVRISVSDTGIQGNDTSSYLNLCISANGRFITFISQATNLVPGAPAGTYLYDRALRHIQSASSVGAGFLSGEGRTFGFTSSVSNLVAGDTNGALDVFVTDLTSLEPPLPAFALDRGGLQFGATSTGAAFVQQTPAQSVRLSQIGSGSAAWVATPTQPWITVSPASGTGPALLTIGVQFAPGLPLTGTSSAGVTIALTGADNAVGPIAVDLTTTPVTSSAGPLGVFDTPLDGTTGVTGSVAVTGWALDDIGILRVRIMRDPLPAEGSALIFIGTAVFIDGARPDVAAAFPLRPLNSRAGWGYMLLTNFLPNQGNGTFTLHAMADDLDGHSVEIGTKTITCANSAATRPFGAIDTPAQGEVIGGSAYANFGWVLARAPALAFPPHGTVSVLIDGVPVTSPGGWASRSDLTALFSAATYPGVGNALGVAGIDTTALANGVHTIAWIVTADNGQADGIGSRFFTVANGSVPARTARSTSASAGRPAASLALDGQVIQLPMRDAARTQTAGSLADEVNAAPAGRAPVRARTGFALTAPLRSVAADDSDRATIYGQELDRFDVRLAGAGAASQPRFTGYLRAGADLAALPIGSHLDERTGTFTWQPGPGFLRAYDLVFVRWAEGRASTRQEVRIVINPAARSRVGPQVTIDIPTSAATVTQPFMVAGWAIDADAAWDTGVDGLHVWAYPVEQPRQPIFLGVAAYGGARPDVAAVFGESFRRSGYGIVVDTLPPGPYDIALFAWSTARNGFLPARTVRVTVR